MFIYRILRDFIILSLLVSSAFSQPSPKEYDQNKVYRVGVYQLKPFSTQKDGEFSGFTVKIWESVAAHAGIKYQLVPYKGGANAGINLLKQHKLDVLVGPVSVLSKRLEYVDFSRPFYINKLAYISQKNLESFWTIINYIAKKFFGLALLVCVVLLILYAVYLTVNERKANNPEYQGSLFKVYLHALYVIGLAFISRQVPHDTETITKKTLGLSWLIVAMILMSILIGTITSSMTISFSTLQLQREGKPPSFIGHKIAVKRNSYSAALMKLLDADVESVPTLNDALDLLSRRRVSGVVGDALSLHYYTTVKYPGKFSSQQMVIGANEFAFAFPKHSPLLEPVNISLTKLQQANAVYGICRQYIGAKNAVQCVI